MKDNIDLKDPLSFCFKTREPGWYPEAIGMDVRHLVGLSGIIVREPKRDQAVFLTPIDVSDILECETRSGYDLSGLARNLVHAISNGIECGSGKVSHWEVHDDEFVTVLRLLKRECRSRKPVRFSTYDTRAKPILPEEMASILNGPDDSLDLAG